MRNMPDKVKEKGKRKKEKVRSQKEKLQFKIKNFKFWVVVLPFAFLVFSSYCFAYEPPKYEIEVSVDTISHIIQAKQKVTFVNNSDKAVKEVYFHIYPNRKYSEEEKRFISRYAAYFKVNLFPDGFQSGSIKINSISSSGQGLKYQIEGQDQTILRVALEKEVTAGSSAVLELEYQVEIPHCYGRFGWNKNITSLLRWYPLLSVLDNQGWHNYPFYPYHQPYFSEAAIYSVKLTVAKDQIAIHSGVLKEEKQNPDGSKTIFIQSELPLRDFGLALSPDYKVQSLEAGGIKINSYYLEGGDFYAQKAAEFARDLIKSYSQKLGPYPYKEFNIAPSYLAYGGTQSSNLILIDSRAYRLPKFLIRYFDFLISHETGHQWFYNIAGSDEYQEMVIDEGLNSYFILKHLEDKYAPEAQVMVFPKALRYLIPNFYFQRAQTDRYSFTAENGLDSPALNKLSSFQEPSSIFSITYGKGSKIWDMLNFTVGDEIFNKIMRRIFTEYKFRNISMQDIEVLAKEESGQDLGWFFQEWFKTSKKCDYAVREVKDNKVVVENRAEIRMPVELLVEFEDGAKQKLFWDGLGKEKEFLLEYPQTIKSVQLDPEKRLLDLDRVNNNWKRKIDIKPVLLYYPIYEIPVFLKDAAYSLVFGPQIGSDLGIRASLQKPQDNILYLSSAYNFGEQRIKNVLGFEQHHLGGKLLKWGIEAFDYNDTSGKDDQDGFKLYLRKELWPASYGLMDDNDHISLYLLKNRDFKSALTSGGLEDIRNLYYRKEDQTIAGLNLKLGRYGTYPDPREGWKFISTLENAGHFLGGDNYFWRLSPELTRYFFLSPGQVIAARAKLGLGYPDDKGLFQLGGEKSLRGFAYKTINGSQAAMLNLEYRRDIIDELDLRFFDNIISLEKIQAVGFFDIGKSWFNSFNQRSFKKDIGIGLRLHFTLGSFLEKFVLRLDAAQPLNQPKNKRHYWVGLGHTF